jgi:DNA replication protein DnaC
MTAEQFEHLRFFRVLMRDADIPARHAAFRTADSTCPEWDSVLASMRGLVGKGFLCALVGTRGAYKTQLAVELLRLVCWRGKPGLYRRVMEFFVDLKSSYNGGDETEAAVLARYAAPALLVLDEAHERGGTTWESSMLNLLIDKRYAAMKDTVLIANLTRAELPGALGPSIMRRLDDTGGIVECAWGRMGQIVGALNKED